MKGVDAEDAEEKRKGAEKGKVGKRSRKYLNQYSEVSFGVSLWPLWFFLCALCVNALPVCSTR
jgi:hypothetical protein